MFRAMTALVALAVVGCGGPNPKRIQGNWVLEKTKDRTEKRFELQAAPILVFDEGMVTEVDSASRVRLLSYRAKTPYRIEENRLIVGQEEAQIVELSESRLVYLRGAEYTFRRITADEVEKEIQRRWGKTP